LTEEGGAAGNLVEDVGGLDESKSASVAEAEPVESDSSWAESPERRPQVIGGVKNQQC